MAFYPLALVPLGSLVWVALNWPGAGTGRTTVNIDVGARAVDEHRPAVRRARRDHERAGARRSARWSSSTAPTTSITTTGTPRSGCPASPPNWSRSPAPCSAWWSATTCWCSTCSGSSPRCCRSCWSATTPNAPPAAGPRLRRCWSRRSAGWRCWSASSCSATSSGTYLLSELIAAPPTGVAASVGVVLVLDRRAVQVGDRSDALLAAGRDGRTDTGQRLPARRRDGQGGRLSRRADDARGSPTRRRGGRWWSSLGVLTMLLAGWRAVREYDLKLILAFGTVSQLGLITVMVGAGGGDLMLAGLAMLCAHAMFKAALFMVVGIIDHATGTRDIRRLAWLGQRSRPLLDHRRRRDREHGRAATVPRLRRQGGRLRNRRCTARHSAPRRPTCSPASCSARCSPPSTACGSCGERSRRKG